jgi:hypothetical protein
LQEESKNTGLINRYFCICVKYHSLLVNLCDTLGVQTLTEKAKGNMVSLEQALATLSTHSEAAGDPRVRDAERIAAGMGARTLEVFQLYTGEVPFDIAAQLGNAAAGAAVEATSAEEALWAGPTMEAGWAGPTKGTAVGVMERT